MLQVPAHSLVDDVTVFGDDDEFWVYYLVPSVPSLRLDQKGDPVFLLVKYVLSDQDRQQNPHLPAGGGYLSFDTTLAVPEATLTEITTALQAEVDAEWHRRRAGTAAEQASTGVVGTTAPPAVRFDTPTWTQGKVAVDAPQSTSLVVDRLTEGAPSLLGGATAVFDLDLTPAGATFMEQTLVAPTGQGATDLTPIQVAYDLSFWARLPPVRIVVVAQSQKIHDYVHQQLQGRGIDWCTTYDFDHTDIQTDTVTSTGTITVSIDQGSGSLPPDALNQLTNYALDLVKQMISSSFFTSTPPAAQGPNPALPADDGTTRKWFRHVYDATTMNLNLDLQQRSVVQWDVHPQATLESWFQGMSAASLDRFVRRLNLDDPFFQNLEVTARAFADYEGPVQSVTVDLVYGPSGPLQKTTSMVFTDTTPQTWQVALIGTERSYQYRTTVGWKDHDPSPPGDWVTTSSPVVNAEATAGAVTVAVLAGDIDFDTIAQVQVQLAYEDDSAGVAREEFTVVLTRTQKEASYSRLIYQPVTKLVQYRTRFTLSSGEVQDDPIWHDLHGPQLVVNQDTTSILQVSLLPTGDGWADVTRVLVDLHYEDPANNLVKDDTVVLTSVSDFKTWTVNLRDKSQRSYKYKWTASFKTGQLSTTKWQTVNDGTDTLPVVLQRPGIAVTLVADAVDFKACPVVEVNCHYAQGGIDRLETFVFKDKAAQQWVIDAPQGAPVDYVYQVTYSPGDRDPVTKPPVQETSTVVIIPPYQVPGAGKLTVQILGSLIDFTATPLVGVDLTYDDDGDSVHQTTSVTLSRDVTASTWQVDLKDASAKAFGYTITYFTPDGVAHAQPAVRDLVPRIVVPRFQPLTP